MAAALSSAEASRWISLAGAAAALEPTASNGDVAKAAEHAAAKRAQINEIIGADTLGYLSTEHVVQLAQNANCGFCTACFTGKYAVKPEEVLSTDIHIGAIFLQPNQFVLSQLLVIAQDTCVLIIKLPADRAYHWGNSRLCYWRIAWSPVLKCSITNKKLAAAGYFSILNYYESLYLCG